MRAVVQSLREPRTERAQFIDHPLVVRQRARVVGPLEHEQIDVLEQESAALLRRHGARRSSIDQIGRVRQDPRIPEHASAHEHALDAGLHATDDLLGFDAVAAAEDRNRQVVRNRCDQIPIGSAGVALRGGAPVNGNGCGAGVFDHLRQRRRIPLVVVPARSHLHGHGNADRPGHRRDHTGRVRRLAHQAAAGIVLRDLRHRAAHVDVDDVGAHAFDDLCSGGHLVGIAAEDLNRDRPFLFGVLGVLERAVDAADETFGAHHLGDDQTASAMTLHEPAERRVGHTGHRGDGEGRWKLH